uniref:Uncharacterized protein n=1 Tax=Cucumis melo TaxID=3656 RepID=A0A9I9EGS9_CUCME
MALSNAPPGLPLFPMTNRTTIPFSFSNFFKDSPAPIINCSIPRRFLRFRFYGPRGIHVSRIESRRFLLLKAVLIPITTNAFSGGSGLGFLPFVRDNAISISQFPNVFSRDLPNQSFKKRIQQQNATKISVIMGGCFKIELKLK